MDVKAVLEKLKLSSEKEKSFKARLGRTATPVVLMPQKGVKVSEVTVEAKVAEIKGHDSTLLATGLSFTCAPHVINHFTIGGNPLTAKWFSYSVGPISWSAGEGWPVYTSYCPLDSYGQGNYYRDAKLHQIVPGIESQNYFIGCLSSGVCASPGVGQITFAVNDSYYDDNRGYFEVFIYGWS